MPAITVRVYQQAILKPPLHEKQRVVLNIEKLDMPCKDACASFLELKYKKDKIATGARLCCGNPGTIYADIGTDVLVILRSESKLDSKFKGFELTYKSGKFLEGKTTEEPPTTTVEEGIWSKWGGWSGCSASCGACGQRRRVRTCFTEKCKGEPLQVERCSFGVCRLTKHRTNRCQGRLVMPCDLLESLEFGTVIKYDGIRQAENGMEKCIKMLRFSYNCPTALLTISMDWQQTKSAGNHHKSNGNVDEGEYHRECCPGFTPSEGQCVLKGR
uniref:NTR domain-containing protein n=1 Tax=Globodera pallida TaxID=36090 RepID=A0A183BI06_GLOPA